MSAFNLLLVNRPDDLRDTILGKANTSRNLFESVKVSRVGEARMRPRSTPILFLEKEFDTRPTGTTSRTIRRMHEQDKMTTKMPKVCF